MFRWVTKRELAEYRIEEVTDQFESSVNLIRHLLDNKFLQLALYGPPKNQKQGRCILTGDHYGIGQKFVICNFLNFESNLIKFGPHIGVIVAFVSCKNQPGGAIFWRLVDKYVQDCQSSYSPAGQNNRIYESNSAEKVGCKTF